MTATIEDVAREAGVSRGTVSNVLNNLPTVSEENRRKVAEAVKKLKYRPNTAARTLKTKTSRSIGLVLPDISNPFYPEIARGVEDAAQKLGYSIFLCNNDRSVEKERNYINVLMEKSVDGIILVKPKISREEMDEIRESCRVVLVDMDDVTGAQYDIINVDDYSGAMDAMRLLYEYGHTRIAYISGLLESKSSQSRKRAYLDFLREKNLDADDTLIRQGSYDWYSGYVGAVELLRQVTPPTAIFAANDLMAIGAMKAIRERRLNIPFDISVVGCDDIDLAALYSPQLTTVRQPKYEMGAAAAETLVRRIQGARDTAPGEGSLTILKTEIIFRETVGYAKRG